MAEDLLYRNAMFFKTLLNKTYHIKAGRKGEIIELDIFFLKEHFYHLLGMGKLADMPDISCFKNKNAFFNEVITGKVTYDKIRKSSFISDIQSRVEDFLLIQDVLDNLKHGELVLQYDNKKRSSIKADYLIFKGVDDGYIHLFLKIKDKSKCIPCSFFKNKGNGYIVRQKRYTIIEITVSDKVHK